MYIDTKERGFIYEPIATLNKPLFDVLVKYQSTIDGSRLYDDLIDVFVNQELDYHRERSEKHRDTKNIDKDGDFVETV